MTDQTPGCGSTTDAAKRLADLTVVGNLDARTGRPATVYTPPECLTPTPRWLAAHDRALLDEAASRVAAALLHDPDCATCEDVREAIAIVRATRSTQ